MIARDFDVLPTMFPDCGLQTELTMTDKKLPIRDKAFHEQALRDLDDRVGTPEGDTLIQWHVTAICYLEYGAFHHFTGPAVEMTSGGHVVPVAIEPWLWLIRPATETKPAHYAFDLV